jgi:hypothetical protein
VNTTHPASAWAAATVAGAGVAWARYRGISAVELRIDNSEWQPCALSDVATTDTWRQWRAEWDAEPGDRELTVRTTDGDGNVQTSKVQGVLPDGATGLHSVSITVE